MSEFMDMGEADFDISEPRTDELSAVLALCAQATDAAALPADERALDAFRLHDGGLCLVARKGNELAAVLLCTKQAGRHRIAGMVVKESYEDQGLERLMLDKVLVKLNARGAHTLRLADEGQGEYVAWESMKWQGDCDLARQIPLGRMQTCPA